MIVNLIGTITDNTQIHHLTQFNSVVTFFLHRALKGLGVDAQLVPYGQIYDKAPPTCDHSIVIVGSAFVEFDTKRAKQRPHIFGTEERRKIAKQFCDRIYNTTRDKVTLYIDSNYAHWDSYFDKIFTVAPPKWSGRPSPKLWTHPERYVHVGWGADPEYCYPDKNKQKTIFIDFYETNPAYIKRAKGFYDIYDRVLGEMTDAKIYDNRRRQLQRPWPDIQKLFRESHFYIDPQYGRTGLTRIESAMCGCLLVTAKNMFAPWAMGQLTAATWTFEKELRRILEGQTNPKQIHDKVKHITWNEVAKRIIVELED